MVYKSVFSCESLQEASINITNKANMFDDLGKKLLFCI